MVFSFWQSDHNQCQYRFRCFVYYARFYDNLVAKLLIKSLVFHSKTRDIFRIQTENIFQCLKRTRTDRPMNSHGRLCMKRIEPQWKERKKRQHQESKSKATKPTATMRIFNVFEIARHFILGSVVFNSYVHTVCYHAFWTLRTNLWTPITRFYTKIIVRCTVCLSLSISFMFFICAIRLRLLLYFDAPSDRHFW